MTTAAIELLLRSQADGAALSAGDGLLLIALAGCSLDEKSGSNWVQDNGGLPEYICRIARALKRSGHPTSEAVGMAVGTVKNWASGQKGVTPETRAKAASAVAEWEALRAKAHAKKAGKEAVKASGEQYQLVTLCAPEFNTDAVRDAFESQLGKKMYPGYPKTADGYHRAGYVQQMWTTFVVVTGDLDADDDTDYYKLPYAVDPTSGAITFGAPIEVHQEWVTGDGTALTGDGADLDASDMTDDDMDALMELSHAPKDALAPFLMLAQEKS